MKSELQSIRSQLKSLRTSIKNSTTALFDSSNNIQFEIKSRRLMRGHFGKVYSVAWSSDSSRIVSAAQDGKLLIWNARTGNKVNAILLRSNWVMTCAFAPSSRLVACGGLDNLVNIYENKEGEDFVSQPILELSKHSGYVSNIQFMDESSVLSASGDASIIHWDLEKKVPVNTWSCHTGDVMSLALLPNSQVCDFRSSNSYEQTLVSSPFTEKDRLETSTGLSDVLNESINQDDNINILNSDIIEKPLNGQILDSETDNNSHDNIDQINNKTTQETAPSNTYFSNLFVSGSCDTSCKLFDLREKFSVYSYEGHKEDINAVSSMAANCFLSGGDEGIVNLWDMRSHSIIGKFETFNSVSDITTSKSGRIVIAALDDKDCVMFDTLNGQMIGRMNGHEQKVSCVKVNPSGSTVVTGSWDRTMRLWG